MAVSETGDLVAGNASATETGQRLQLNIRLQPVDHSEQPIYSNFTVVQGAPGSVFLDFGFLDPTVLPALARLAQSGGKVPETINGQLACRMVLGLDAAAQLAQQLDQHLRGLQSRAQKSPPAQAAGSSKK